jgi:hypothetical protein
MSGRTYNSSGLEDFHDFTIHVDTFPSARCGRRISERDEHMRVRCMRHGCTESVWRETLAVSGLFQASQRYEMNIKIQYFIALLDVK